MYCFVVRMRRPPRSTLSSSSAASDVYKGEDGVKTRKRRFVKRLMTCIHLVLQVGTLANNLDLADLTSAGAMAEEARRYDAVIYILAIWSSDKSNMCDPKRGSPYLA